MPSVSETFEYKDYYKAFRWRKSKVAELQELRLKSYARGKSRTTMNELLDTYISFLEDELTKKRIKDQNTQTYKISHAKFWKEHLGHIKTDKIQPEDIDRVKTEILEGSNEFGRPLANSTINSYLFTLSNCFTIAYKKRWPYLIPAHNPLKFVEKLKNKKGREVLITPEQFEEFLEGCRVHGSRELYEIVLFAARTGARQGEILGLKWKDVELTTGEVTFRDTKNGEDRRIEVIPALVELLKARKKEAKKGDKYVWNSPVYNNQPITVKTTFYRIRKKLGFEFLNFHDLRHFYISSAVRSGAITNPLELQKLVGHKTQSVTMNYTHLFKGHQREISQKVADFQSLKSEDIDLEDHIEETPSPTPPKSEGSRTTKEKLIELKELFDMGLMTEEIYKSKQSEILADF